MFMWPIVANSAPRRDPWLQDVRPSSGACLPKNVKNHVWLVCVARDKPVETWLELHPSGRETASRFSSLSGCLGV